MGRNHVRQHNDGMKTKPYVAALTFELTSGTEIQLLPAGPRFRAVDGRPHDVTEGWLINAEIAQRVIAQMAARTNPFVIDYEHQTLSTTKNGQPAPAAGWFQGSNVVWREGQGLFATDVKWTAAAKQMIDADEYKFISPVFHYDDTGAVTRLFLAAITNNPGLDGMDAVTALAAAYAAQQSENPSMEKLLELLRQALGLAADADENALHAALTAALGKHANFAALTAEHSTQVAALTANQYDPTRYVALSVYNEANSKVAQLTADLESRDRESLMKAALSDGRLLPHMKTWAEGLTVAALTEYLKTAKPLAVLTGTQTDDQDRGKQTTSLDEDTLKICRVFGTDPAAVQKTLEAETQ